MLSAIQYIIIQEREHFTSSNWLILEPMTLQLVHAVRMLYIVLLSYRRLMGARSLNEVHRWTKILYTARIGMSMDDQYNYVKEMQYSKPGSGCSKAD